MFAGVIVALVVLFFVWRTWSVIMKNEESIRRMQAGAPAQRAAVSRALRSIDSTEKVVKNLSAEMKELKKKVNELAARR